LLVLFTLSFNDKFCQKDRKEGSNSVNLLINLRLRILIKKSNAMKNAAVYFAGLVLVSASCTMNQKASVVDDVYLVPTEERTKAKLEADEKAKQEALAREYVKARQSQANNEGNSSLASEDLGNNNPYYKEPSYSADDYYDYQYASRINRFYNPVGLGYYDNYYTNLYTYNPMPFNYGVSIYSSNWCGMPSAQFSNWSLGMGSGFGNGCNTCMPNYGYYDPWFNQGFNQFNGFGYTYGYGGFGWSNPYNNWSYMAGYNNGFNNGYWSGVNNSGWGYFNSFDQNSGYGRVLNAPRTNNGGDNSRIRNTNGLVNNSNSSKYFEEVAEQQRNRPRFSASDQKIMRRNSVNNQETARPTYINSSETKPTPQGIDNNRTRRQPSNDRIMEKRPVNDAPSRREQPVITPKSNQIDNGGGRSRSSGGTSSPRNSGGGSSRPR